MALAGFEAGLTDAVERLRPSVVRVVREVARRGRRGPEVPGVDGAGSGLVVASRGLVVTNDHVVREATGVRVAIEDGRELPAEVLGEDPATDLALLRVPVTDLTPAAWADSERLRVGQLALAVGNSLGLPGGPTVSLGVVSAVGRRLPGSEYVPEGIVQTDAAINPGNSGGPLANLSGEVVGINTAMVAFAQGVGFAVPANTVRWVVEQLAAAGRVARPWVGIVGAAVEPALRQRMRLGVDRGVFVVEVAPGGPAEAAGVLEGDVLVRLGREPLSSIRDLLGALRHLPIGGAVDLELNRDGKARRAVLRVGESPVPAAG